MKARQKVGLLIGIMFVVVVVVESFSVGMLYNAAFEQQRVRLVETVRGMAGLIEAVASFDDKYSKDYPEGSRGATLSQIVDALSQYHSHIDSGELTVSKKDGDSIAFLVHRRETSDEKPSVIPFASSLALPMRRALSGLSGTVVGLDYRGEKVLAAHVPIDSLSLGIVAKVDVDEIRRPFIRAAIVSGLIAMILIIIGAVLFAKITGPLIRELSNTVSELSGALDKVNVLSGLLPICAVCKQIRDEEGSWQQMESYIRANSEAEFSHSYCPDCAKKIMDDL